MKKTSFDLDFSFDLPNFDGLLDDIVLDVSLDGIDLVLDLDLSDDSAANREGTERKPPGEDC